MEQQCSPLIWASWYCQKEGVDELKQSLLYSSLELEAALVSAHEGISRKDHEILQLKGLLAKMVDERDELHAKCRDLAVENQLLFHQVQILARSSKQSPISSSNGDNHNHNHTDRSPSDCADTDSINVLAASHANGKDSTLPTVLDIAERVAIKGPLPERGRFLQAVMEAGPLLQNLLLAGPLPQWQHPPPQINSFDIPPVTISSPRILAQDFSPSPKHQRV